MYRGESTGMPRIVGLRRHSYQGESEDEDRTFRSSMANWEHCSQTRRTLCNIMPSADSKRARHVPCAQRPVEFRILLREVDERRA
jgi:hypothetical protein